MKTFYVTQGLPASGKSSWARETLDYFRGSDILAIRVNRDCLREMLHFNVWNKPNEMVTVATRNLIIGQLMAADVPVIICDDTNLDPKVLDDLTVLAEQYGYEANIKDFTDVPVWKCIERDFGRTGYARVGPKVILDMYNKYLKENDEPVQEA
jgi:predicted kinase